MIDQESVSSGPDIMGESEMKKMTLSNRSKILIIRIELYKTLWYPLISMRNEFDLELHKSFESDLACVVHKKTYMHMFLNSTDFCCNENKI